MTDMEMEDLLYQHIQKYKDKIRDLEKTVALWRGIHEGAVLALQKRIKQLEAALRNIAEDDIPRTVKIPFYDDGKPSKHDRCEHGQWMYEDCGCCIEDYARAVLEEKKDAPQEPI